MYEWPTRTKLEIDAKNLLEYLKVAHQINIGAVVVRGWGSLLGV